MLLHRDTRSARPARVLLALSVVLGAGVFAAPAIAQPSHALRVSASTKSVTPGRLTTVTVRVVNSGRRTASHVRLSVGAGKGLSFAPTHPHVASRLRPKRSSLARVKVRLAGGGATSSLRFAASASHTRTARRTVRVKPKSNGIAGRYFWRTEYVSTTYYYGYYFVNDKWAYRGIPKGGLPSCTARTAPDTEKDGCVPYSYSAKTGSLVVDGKSGKIEGTHQIAVDGNSYAEAAVPGAGTRYQATGQYINSYGFAPYGTFVTIGIELHADGQFGRSSTISGSTPSGDFGALPPDQHGTYAILPNGRIHYTYVDGHTVDETIGVLYDKAGRPDPNYGLLLDDGVFFGPHSDVN